MNVTRILRGRLQSERTRLAVISLPVVAQITSVCYSCQKIHIHPNRGHRVVALLVSN